MKSFTAQFLMITILFVVCIAMPCYAEEIEVDRFFTPERTSWRINDASNIISFDTLGFFEGYIWLCESNNCAKFDNSNYFNWVISKFDASACFQILNISFCYSVSGYTIPLLRFGKLAFCVDQTGECIDFTLTKVNDNFSYVP